MWWIFVAKRFRLDSGSELCPNLQPTSSSDDEEGLEEEDDDDDFEGDADLDDYTKVSADRTQLGDIQLGQG